MSIKSTTHPLFLVFSIVLFSYANSAHAAGSRQFIPFSSGTAQIKLDTGRIVNLDSAQACIDRFPAFMAAHGFAAQAGQPINLNLTTTSQITTGETFSGKDLQKWLDATMAAYKKAGKTLMVKVQLGVYDMNYLNTYQPNAAKRAAANNRIAIFIMPYDASSGQAIRALTAQPMGSGGTGTGYDFGGLQP